MIPSPAQHWRAFLVNHRDAIAAMDFFTVPTITFGVLYCFFVICHDRRRILHCLKRLLSEYLPYHREDRTHLGLGKGTPGCRTRCVTSGRVVSHDRLGGLHHRYDRTA